MDNEFGFPPVEAASEDGLVAIGGPLTAGRVTAAYRRGIFPWPLEWDGQMILAWFSPDPRAVFELDRLYVSKRLRRRIDTGRYRATCDQQFQQVMLKCAAPRHLGGGTWITPEMIQVYTQLHHLGVAHSVEIWEDQQLVGGVYGIGIGAFFAGESMFHRVRDGSKMALVYLVAHLRARGFVMFDIQQTTEHCVRMGATEVARPVFLTRLERAIGLSVTFGTTLDTRQLVDVLRRR